MSGSNQRVIPREESSAWERWELGNIHDEHAQRRRQPAPEPVEEVVEVAPLPEPVEYLPEPEPLPEVMHEAEEIPADAVPLPTAEELEAIRQQAHAEGFEAGLESGRLMAEAELQTLQGLLQSLGALSAEHEMTMADAVLDLAIVLARQMTRSKVEADRHGLLPLIRDAVASLPMARAPSRLYLHPDDLAALDSLLAAELTSDVWRLLPDPMLEQGGCRIETPTSQLDLSLAARWATQLRALGRERRADLEWAAPVADAPPPVQPAPARSAAAAVLNEPLPEPPSLLADEDE
ncbi:flagellar assembly protein FliH [Andreprevotia lacus DSM 23236]|uniref:Flagellar assembly protein FliH n=1 Tax=Andreprevotia lacus DSM 23236 TaxID=1121001 RepID=A0A1W1XA51_9NEIS|nr:FliH/SctL family protein [Andreprevotia lacus]SMC20548.1 flagellar assembly protein FliH [Andreprevotia lacus DSM 23236]